MPKVKVSRGSYNGAGQVRHPSPIPRAEYVQLVGQQVTLRPPSLAGKESDGFSALPSPKEALLTVRSGAVGLCLAKRSEGVAHQAGQSGGDRLGYDKLVGICRSTLSRRIHMTEQSQGSFPLKTAI
jgi:hypothetical protein